MIVPKKLKSEKGNVGEFTISTTSNCYIKFIMNTFGDSDEIITLGSIKNELMTYGGTMFSTHIEFETEEQLSLFILKFS